MYICSTLFLAAPQLTHWVLCIPTRCELHWEVAKKCWCPLTTLTLLDLNGLICNLSLLVVYLYPNLVISTDVGAYKPRDHATLVMNSKILCKIEMQSSDVYLLYSIYCRHCTYVIHDNKIILIVIDIVIVISCHRQKDGIAFDVKNTHLKDHHISEVMSNLVIIKKCLSYQVHFCLFLHVCA